MNRVTRLSLAVPCYNEEAVIRDCASQLRACVDRLVQAGIVPGSDASVWEGIFPAAGRAEVLGL